MLEAYKIQVLVYVCMSVYMHAHQRKYRHEHNRATDTRSTAQGQPDRHACEYIHIHTHTPVDTRAADAVRQDPRHQRIRLEINSKDHAPAILHRRVLHRSQRPECRPREAGIRLQGAAPHRTAVIIIAFCNLCESFHR